MLFLGDNLGCILALSRSRAKDYQMLVQVRRVAAWSLARGVRISFRWIPSEWNTADDPSRLAEAAAIADDKLEEILPRRREPKVSAAALRPLKLPRVLKRGKFRRDGFLSTFRAVTFWLRKQYHIRQSRTHLHAQVIVSF